MTRTRPCLGDLGEVSARLTPWLAAKLQRPDLEIAEIRPLTGGLVNTIHLVTVMPKGGEEQRRYVLRWDPITGPQAPYDMANQFETFERLRRTAIPVPEPLWLETGEDILGRSFWLSEFLQADPVARILDLTDAPSRARMAAYLAMLGRIHSTDWRAVGLERARPTITAGALDRLVAEEEPYLVFVPEGDRATFSRAKDYLASQRPSDFELSLTHGDCSVTNYLFRGSEIIGVVDWDLAIITDRSRDVAFYCSLIYRFNPDEPASEKDKKRSRFVADYERQCAITLTNLPYWEVYTNYHNALSWLRPGWTTSINGYAGYTQRLAALVS